MRVKLYRAEGMQAAMAQMRADLGADALILTSRRVAGGVELTAALDAPEEMPAPVLEQVSPAVVPDAARHAMLVHHRMPASVARKLQAGALPFAVSTVFRFARLDLGVGSRPLMLVGLPGGGNHTHGQSLGKTKRRANGDGPFFPAWEIMMITCRNIVHRQEGMQQSWRYN